MKKILLLMFACLATMWGIQAMPLSKDNDDSADKAAQQLTKAQKKAVEKRLQQIHDSIDHVFAEEALNEGYFVLMADRINMRNYTYPNPQPNMNFVLVQGNKATIQLAFNNGSAGLNGLGGITVEGSVSGVKMRTDKKGKIYMDFSVMGAAVSAQVFITLYEDSNSAMAIINPNFGPGSMTVYGKLVPYNGNDTRKAFKGISTP